MVRLLFIPIWLLPTLGIAIGLATALRGIPRFGIAVLRTSLAARILLRGRILTPTRFLWHALGIRVGIRIGIRLAIRRVSLRRIHLRQSPCRGVRHQRRSHRKGERAGEHTPSDLPQQTVSRPSATAVLSSPSNHLSPNHAQSINIAWFLISNFYLAM